MHKVDRIAAPFTPRFAELKRSLIAPEDEDKLTESWNKLLVALKDRTEEIKKTGSPVSVCLAETRIDSGPSPDHPSSRVQRAFFAFSFKN